MISEQRLAYLIYKLAPLFTPQRKCCAILKISPGDIPADMPEAEIIENIKTIYDYGTSAEDFCDDSTLVFNNPFTGEKYELVAGSICSFFDTSPEGEPVQRLRRLLGDACPF